MKRVKTWNALDQIASADLNTWQDRNAGVRAGSGAAYAGTATSGSDEVHAQETAGYANADLTLVDANHDWRGRTLFVQSTSFASVNDLPGGSADYGDWAATGTFAAGAGYSGTGAYSNVGAGPAAVSAGNPPLAATGGAGTSYRVTVTTNVWLYADPTTGALYLYNNTGAAWIAWLQVKGTAALGV